MSQIVTAININTPKSSITIQICACFVYADALKQRQQLFLLKNYSKFILSFYGFTFKNAIFVAYVTFFLNPYITL